MEKQKAQTTRHKILKTSVKLFARKGFANTGMRELSREAGVNLAMINYCFGNKKELLKIILDTFFSGYIAIVEHELTGPGDYEQKIRRLIREIFIYFTKHRDYLIVTLTELPFDDPEITRHKAEWAKQAMLLFQKEICRPLEHKYGIKLSPVEVGPTLLGLLSTRFLLAPIIEQVQPQGYDETFNERYPDLIANIFLHGIHGLAEHKKGLTNESI